jgi:outer membrane receptor for ferric coprogen and ferric-rhodotorulic acid
VLRLSSTYQLLPQLKLGAALRWQSGISDAAGTVQQKAYGVLDLNGSYEFNRHWSASLAVHNVNNANYLGSLKWDQAYYAAPRSVNATLSWKY